MRVHAETVITAVEVVARIQAAAETDAARSDPGRRLCCDPQRVPPRVSLTGLPVLPAAGAHVTTEERTGATDVTLQFRWGPMPAGVVRMLAALGGVLALAVLVGSDRSAGSWLAAALLVALPLGALFYQRAGEATIQARLADVLQTDGFTPGPR